MKAPKQKSSKVKKGGKAPTSINPLHGFIDELKALDAKRAELLAKAKQLKTK